MVAQAAQAALGLIPASALAVGVAIGGTDVELRFQLSEGDEQATEDMRDIADGLSVLLGDDCSVEFSHEIRESGSLSPHDSIRWFFAARRD